MRKCQLHKRAPPPPSLTHSLKSSLRPQRPTVGFYLEVKKGVGVEREGRRGDGGIKVPPCCLQSQIKKVHRLVPPVLRVQHDRTEHLILLRQDPKSFTGLSLPPLRTSDHLTTIPFASFPRTDPRSKQNTF